MHFTIRITKAHLKMGLKGGGPRHIRARGREPRVPRVHPPSGRGEYPRGARAPPGQRGRKAAHPHGRFLRAGLRGGGRGGKASSSPRRAVQPVPLGPIDVERALAALAAREAGVAEPRAFAILRRKGPWPDAGRRLHLAQDRIRCRTPRPCRVCGKEFAGQLHAVTCRACKAAGQRRCCACGEVFKGAPKAKRCPGCLEKYAALEAERTRTKERGEG